MLRSLVGSEMCIRDRSKPAREVLRHCHGLSPFPGAWCEAEIDGASARLKILRCELVRTDAPPGALLDDKLTVACGKDAIRIVQLQREGKKPMSAADFLRGTPLNPPARFR